MLTFDVAAMRIDGAGELGLRGRCKRILQGAGQVWCELFGHHVLLRYQPERLSLECLHCGYESPGWELSSRLRCQTVQSVHVHDGIARPQPARSSDFAYVAAHGRRQPSSQPAYPLSDMRVYTDRSRSVPERIRTRQMGSALNRRATAEAQPSRDASFAQ